MQSYSEAEIVVLILEMLKQQGMLSEKEMTKGTFQVEPIASDGSSRRFWRCLLDNHSLCVAAAPLSTTVNECRESRSAWNIGTHLYAKGCAVPKLYGWHEDSGLLLFEDLGHQRLHGLVKDNIGSEAGGAQTKELYGVVTRELARLQTAGAVGFDPDWCWDGGCYNKELMLNRESGYFLNAFWAGFLQEAIPSGIEEEFEVLAEMADNAPATYFLHRDFQSRNIMITGGEPKIIDFQAGRLGPLGYDLASLLIDPYCGLKLSLQEDLVDLYLREVTKHTVLDPAQFRHDYNALALQRNLQILGAFAFLTQVREKPFFAAYIQPALQSAQIRLESHMFAELKILKEMIRKAKERL
jgi:aminoglycoside/choline kinase family phosphotransferase